MDIKKLEKWSEDFNILGHPIRLAIVGVLLGSELFKEQPLGSLTFSQFARILNLSANELTYHLHKLIDSGFLQKYPYMNEETHRVFAVYSLTPKAKEFMKDFGVTEEIIGRLRHMQE